MSEPTFLADLLDRDLVAERLSRSGIGPGSARELVRLFSQCAMALRRQGAPPDQRAHALFVPGRIEVLGKHTDYAGGRSLLTALERGFCVVATPREDGHVMLQNIPGAGGRAALELGMAMGSDFRAGWAKYPGAVVERLPRDFPAICRGADIAFSSNLPSASGMSSSSAFVTATFLALADINRLQETPEYRELISGPEVLADYLGAVENGRPWRTGGGGSGVGTRGGSEDHVAILCARPGRVIQYGFRPARLERTLALPVGFTFVVASSGVRAAKGAAALPSYNRLSDLARELEILGRELLGGEIEGGGAGRDASLGALLASSPSALDRLREVVLEKGGERAPVLLDRLAQFAAETFEIIPAAGDALERGDVEEFGLQVDRSQDLAERMLLNQIDQTIDLARSAREVGARAASAFGAGFGGSVWALVREAEADEFIERWKEAYLTSFPRQRSGASFQRARPGPAALRIQ